jgi:uncharacterized ferredoxin-like protein
MSSENKAWNSFLRDAAMLRDADAVLVVTSLRSLTDPSDINCNLCGKLTCEYMLKEDKLPMSRGWLHGPLAPSGP